MKRHAVLFLLVVACAISAAAQSVPHSTLTGKVSSQGSALPGVTVTATSPNLQGARNVVTNNQGDFVLPFLPPGEYSVSFELAGMQTVRRKITLAVARTDRLDIELRPEAIAETMTVTASAPGVLETSQVSTNFKQDLIEQLPVARTLTAVTLLAPGVNPNGPGGNIIISGSMSYDSLYLVDGAIVNENLRGQPHDLFIEDAIQETTVSTAGITAEYGHFTGGVVNAITKSGGNELKGSFRTSLNNESWVSRTPLTTEQADKLEPVYEATLGGPFWKDRLWFFTAARQAKTDDIRQTQPGNARAGDQDAAGNPIPVGTPLTPITYPHTNSERRMEGKLTLALTQKHNFIASYLDIKETETNQTGQVIMDLDSLVKSRRTPNSFLTLNYNGALTDRFFVEGQYSQKKFAFLGSGSPYYDIIKGTLITDRARGTRYWSPTFRATPNGEHRDHELYTAKASYFLSTGNFGTHDVRGGYEHFEEVRDVNNYQNGSDYRISVASTIVRGNTVYGRFSGAGSNTRISWLPILVQSQGSKYASDAIFVTDRWTLSPRWTFNIGARYDKNDARSGDGSFQIADDTAISPRLQVHFDPRANGRLVFNASYSQYIGRLAEGVGNDADPAGRNASFAWNYNGPSINDNVNTPTSQLVPTDEAIKRIMEWFFANGGTDRRPFRTPPSVPGVESILDPSGLKSPNVKEWAAGVGAQLGTRGYLRADLIWRDWDDFYTSFVDLSTGKTQDQYGTRYDQAIIRNDSDLYDRKYYAIQSQFGYRLMQRLNLGGTYTWSRLLGNVTGEDSGSGPLTGVAGERPEYRGASWNYPMGYLTGDQRHRARVWGMYDIPTPVGDVNLSLMQAFDSGTRTSVDGTIDPSPFINNPGYISVPTGISYFFGGRGNLSTDNIHRTDFALNYKLRLTRGIEIFVQPEVLNVFNNQGVQSYDEEVLTNSDVTYLAAFNPFTQTPKECPQGTAAAACTAMGANFQRGENFGLPNSESDYQTPCTFRISMGVRF